MLTNNEETLFEIAAAAGMTRDKDPYWKGWWRYSTGVYARIGTEIVFIAPKRTVRRGLGEFETLTVRPVTPDEIRRRLGQGNDPFLNRDYARWAAQLRAALDPA